MLHDLDKSLEELLRRGMPASMVEQVTISFAAPDAQFPPAAVTLPAIDLFLYDVRENRDARSNEWLPRRAADGSGTMARAPVRVDCSYLVTAWPSHTAPAPAQDEHRILGEVMTVLLRYPYLPAEILQGSLKSQEMPLPAIALQSSRLQNLSEFWQSLGGKLKAALSYTVTLAVEPSRPLDAGPAVVDLRARLGQLTGAV